MSNNLFVYKIDGFAKRIVLAGVIEVFQLLQLISSNSD